VHAEAAFVKVPGESRRMRVGGVCQVILRVPLLAVDMDILGIIVNDDLCLEEQFVQWLCDCKNGEYCYMSPVATRCDS
jgi:hypothetical protein